MIRMYAFLGILALIVALGGYALLERSWRQLAVSQSASLRADLEAATVQLDAERAIARRAAALAATQSKAAQEARQRAQTAEDKSRALIIELAEEPDVPACNCGFGDDFRQRLQRDIPIGTDAPAAPAAAGQPGAQPVR